MKQIEKLTLLHSNDMHGDFLAEEKEGYHEGGVSLLSGYIKQVREEEPNTLFAIAGDMFRGSIIDSESRGLSTIELMNFLSPDVVTVQPRSRLRTLAPAVSGEMRQVSDRQCQHVHQDQSYKTV